MDSSTRIADLPDMGQHAQPQQQMFSQEMSSNTQLPTSYIPMNIHPNPYGNHPPTAVLPPPQQTQLPPKLNANSLVFPGENTAAQMSHHSGMAQSMSLPQSHAQMGMSSHQPQYPLPSRDIPQDQGGYIIDERIQANYIPPPSRKDYIREDEEEEEKLVQRKRKEKRVRFVDDAFVEIQKPVIITLLFLLFQLPFMNAFLFKYLFFMRLFGEDGNMNMWGYVFKSVTFGLLVYGLDYLMTLLSH
jgi:hypothetical protein